MATPQSIQKPQTVFIGIGVSILIMVFIVPIWNAIALLSDATYVYFAGRQMPLWILALCLSIIVLYALTVTAFFNLAPARAKKDETTAQLLACIFITLLGLAFMLVSLPVSRQAIETHNSIMFRCDYSEETHHLYEYSQVLQSIRRKPDCISKVSIESCDGYEPAHPHTTLLKTLERDFACSGFCYRPELLPIQPGFANHSSTLELGFSARIAAPRKGSTLAAVVTAAASEHVGNASDSSSAFAAAESGSDVNSSQADTNKTKEKLGAETSKKDQEGNQEAKVQASQENGNATTESNMGKGTASLKKKGAASKKSSGDSAHSLDSLSPARGVGTPATALTLFSNYNYQATCDGIAAREMHSFVGYIGFQTFCQGIMFLIIAIGICLLKLVTLCLNNKNNLNGFYPPVRPIYAKAAERSV